MLTSNTVGVDRVFEYALVASLVAAIIALWTPVTPYWAKWLISFGLIANVVEAVRK